MPIDTFNPKSLSLNTDSLCPEGYAYLQELVFFPTDESYLQEDSKNLPPLPKNPGVSNWRELPDLPSVLDWEKLLFRINAKGEKESCEGEDKQKRKTEILEKLRELEDKYQTIQNTTQQVLKLLVDKNDCANQQLQTQVKIKRLFNRTLAVFFTTALLMFAAILIVMFFPPAAAVMLPLFTNILFSLAIGAGLVSTFLPSLLMGLSSLWALHKKNKLQTEINLINNELETLDPDNSIRNSLNNQPSLSTFQKEHRLNSHPSPCDDRVVAYQRTLNVPKPTPLVRSQSVIFQRVTDPATSSTASEREPVNADYLQP